MTKTTYTPNDRLDTALNGILHQPERDRPEIGYKALEREVGVTIEADSLIKLIEGVEELVAGFYSGKVSVDYLRELAEREDITHISSKPVYQLK